MVRKRNSEDLEPEDSELLFGAGRGDQSSFSMLYERYSATAMGVAWKICGNRALAEDAVQEAFLSVWRGSGSFRPEKGSVAGYLLSAVHHKAVDAVRREESVKRRQTAAGETLEQTSGEEVLESAWMSLRRKKVRDALKNLSDVQREALELAYLGGLSYPEVAEKLQIPLGTAKTRLRDGMTRLRDVLSSTEAGEPA